MKARRPTQKPAWGWLYGILGGIVALWIIASRATPSPGGDRWLDLVFLGLMFGVMFLWVQVNQVAISQCDQYAFRPRTRSVRIIILPPPEAMPSGVNGNTASRNGQPIQQTEESMVCLLISDRR